MNKKKKNNVKKYLIAGVSIVLVGTGIGIIKNINKCDVPARHRHLYINKNGYVTYLEREDKTVNDFQKQDEFELTYYSNKRLERALIENKLVPIADNLVLIRKLESEAGAEQFSGYENGEAVYTRPGFYAYKYDNETNSFVKSHYVASLEDIMQEYPYVSIEKMYDIINSNQLYDFYSDVFNENTNQENNLGLSWEPKENYEGDFANPDDNSSSFEDYVGDDSLESFFNENGKDNFNFDESWGLPNDYDNFFEKYGENPEEFNFSNPNNKELYQWFTGNEFQSISKVKTKTTKNC